MASYLGVHGSNDTLPHQFPPAMLHTRLWQDGMLDGLSSSGKSYNDYSTGIDELELSKFSEIEDHLDPDIVPSVPPPSSFHQHQLAHRPELCAPDPELGLTPEKRVTFAQNFVRSNTNEKAGRKVVRFNVESSSESELEKSPVTSFIDKQATVKSGLSSKSQKSDSHSHSDSINLSIESCANNDHLGSLPVDCVYSDTPPPNSLESVQVTDIEGALSPERKGKKKNAKLHSSHKKAKKGDTHAAADSDSSIITREQEEIPVVAEYSFPFKDGTEQETGMLLTSAFERPEYNSSLRLGNELKNLSSKKLNVAKVVKEKLEKSEALRTDICEKAASHVNSQGDVFQGLTALELPIDEIISQMEQNQRSKVKSASIKHKKDVKSKDIEEPDLMEFFSPDLQREHVDLTVTGISFPKETLSLASHEKAFDMYKHNLAWEEFD